MSRMPLTAHSAQDLFNDNFAPWVRALGLRVTDIGPKGATMTMDITPELTRMGDILSGQVCAEVFQ